jgi:hypothetical protein
MFVCMTVGTISDIHCKCKQCTFAVTTFILIHTVKKHWANSQECFMLSGEYNSVKFAYGRAFRHSNIQWGDMTESTYVANWSIVAGTESLPLAWIVISRNLEWTELTVISWGAHQCLWSVWADFWSFFHWSVLVTFVSLGESSTCGKCEESAVVINIQDWAESDCHSKQCK